MAAGSIPPPLPQIASTSVRGRQAKRNLLVAFSVGGLLVILIAAVIGKGLGGIATGGLSGGQRSSAGNFKWSLRTVAGVTVESPGEFTRLKLDLKEYGYDASTILIHEIYQASVDRLQIGVGHATYKPEIQANPEEAVERTVAEVSTAGAVRNVKHTFQDTVVSGMAAKRFSLQGEVTGQPFRMEGLAVAHRSELWQVSVAFAGNSSADESAAQRILDSVRLAR